MPNKGGKLYIKVQNWTSFLQVELHPKPQDHKRRIYMWCIRIEYVRAYMEYIINMEWFGEFQRSELSYNVTLFQNKFNLFLLYLLN